MVGSADDRPALHTLFELANDIVATRRFYSDGVGLTETFFDEAKGWLTYQTGAIQLVFTVPETPMPKLETWSRTPAHPEGVLDAPSWAFEVTVEGLPSLVDRLRAVSPDVQDLRAGDTAVQRVLALDPMGRTVEIFAEP